MAALKRAIRKQMNRAAANTQMDGHDLLGVLMSISAEFVARVDDAERRAEFIGHVTGFFPAAVDLERQLAFGPATVSTTLQ